MIYWCFLKSNKFFDLKIPQLNATWGFTNRTTCRICLSFFRNMPCEIVAKKISERPLYKPHQTVLSPVRSPCVFPHWQGCDRCDVALIVSVPICWSGACGIWFGKIIFFFTVCVSYSPVPTPRSTLHTPDFPLAIFHSHPQPPNPCRAI